MARLVMEEILLLDEEFWETFTWSKMMEELAAKTETVVFQFFLYKRESRISISWQTGPEMQVWITKVIQMPKNYT